MGYLRGGWRTWRRRRCRRGTRPRRPTRRRICAPRGEVGSNRPCRNWFLGLKCHKIYFTKEENLFQKFVLLCSLSVVKSYSFTSYKEASRRLLLPLSLTHLFIFIRATSDYKKGRLREIFCHLAANLPFAFKLYLNCILYQFFVHRRH